MSLPPLEARLPPLAAERVSLSARSSLSTRQRSTKGGGYRTDILYCGNAEYGYRHLLGHIKHYFGGWPNFSFSIAQTLKKPAGFVAQKNGNFLESAPILQCFYAGYYIIWTFFVVPRIKTGDIVTAYGREGKRVNQSCP